VILVLFIVITFSVTTIAEAVTAVGYLAKSVTTTVVPYLVLGTTKQKRSVLICTSALVSVVRHCNKGD
jgi:hypothetical protein